MSKQKNEVTVVEGFCDWVQDGPGKWVTDCGDTYFPFIKDFPQPAIPIVNGVKICPWCNREINYIEEYEDE